MNGHTLRVSSTDSKGTAIFIDSRFDSGSERVKPLSNNKVHKVVIATNLAVYHAIGGISLGIFFVLQGALKPAAQFLPNIPPRMVRGKPTEIKTNNGISAYVLK